MDKYDAAIEYLTEHPDEIEEAWASPFYFYSDGGCLFVFVTPTGDPCCEGHVCGCLTTIRNNSALAWTTELTSAIRADEGIPHDMLAFIDAFYGLTVDERRASLSPFGEWQRRFDKTIRSPAEASHDH